MRPLRLAVVLAALGGSAPAAGQTVVPLFDERDIPGADYYGASAGVATGGDALQLAGPDGTRLPLETGAAYAGAVSGRLAYHHVAAGTFAMRVDAPGGPVNLTEADSLVFYVNGPLPVVGPELPRFGLEDAAGHPTAPLPFPLGTTIGFNAGRSGFRPGSSTDAVFTVAYVEAGGLPPELVRPGYPEDLTLSFADVPLDTSQAAIGLPAIPARFRIDAATGLQLDFRFRDLNGNRTLDQPGEFIEVLTVAPGTTSDRVTWRIALDVQAADPPGEDDVYLLAVDNAGLDADPATWQRVGVRMIEFGPLGAFDLTQVRGLRFSHGGTTAGSRTVWFDAARAVDRGPNPTGPEPPTGLATQAGDATVVLRWTPGAGALGTHVYRAADPQGPFERLSPLPMRTPDFADLTATNGQPYTYILRSVGAFGTTGPDSAPAGATPAAGAGDPFLDLNAERAFFYFWEQANPANGLVRDRSRTESASSIAAVGFGLTAIPIGIEHGWVTREAGRQRVLNTLRHLWSCPQGPQAVGVCGYRGFYYHFLTMDAGLRDGGTELSTIDSALLFGGVIFAREYFDGADAGDVEVRALADSITRRVDWEWAAPRPPRVALGWFPDTGFIDADWTGYNEAMLIYILGLGSPTHPLADGAWAAWTSGYTWATHYGSSFVEFPPLFGHQYTHAWVDFRGIADAYMRDHGIDYFENSRRATLAQRAYSADNPFGHPNYSIDEWGITASDDPFGYSARGAPPAQNDNGTLAPTAPGGSIVFTPAESRAAFRQFYLAYGSQLWGPYGFRDAYNVREDWFATDYIGIDQGPILVMIENLRSGLVWDRFMRNADVLQGLQRAGFQPFVSAEPGPSAAAPALTLAGASPAAARTALRVTLPAEGAARLRVFDLLGREVAVLADGPRTAGAHVVSFDVSRWASGVYVARLEAGGAVVSVRLVVAR